MTIFGGAFMGLILLCAGFALVAFRYAQAARSGNVLPPIKVNPGAALKAIQEALEGNKAAALTALADSFHLEVAAGSIEQKLLSAGFAELERRAADPTAKMPAIDYIAHFSGKSREDVIKFLEAEAGVPHTAAPVLPAVAAALVLLLCGAAQAASPMRVPERFYPEQPNIVIDPPVFYGPVYSHQRSDILLPNHSYQTQPVSYVRYAVSDSEGCELCPNSYYYGNQNVGFWQRGPVRRWIANRGPVRRFFGRLFGRR